MITDARLRKIEGRLGVRAGAKPATIVLYAATPEDAQARADATGAAVLNLVHKTSPEGRGWEIYNESSGLIFTAAELIGHFREFRRLYPG